MKKSLSLLCTGVVLALAGVWPAVAHVTVNPNEAEPEAFTRFAVRVPTERDDAATVKVEVELPEALVAVSFQPKAGWARTVERKPRATAVEVFGEQVSDYIATVTWEGGRIEPGEFEEFAFTARTPAEPTTLRFPALQTYDSGEVVRWVGPEDADEPAARVRVAAAPTATAAHGADDDDGAPASVAWAAAGVAVVALVVAVARRR